MIVLFLSPLFSIGLIRSFLPGPDELQLDKRKMRSDDVGASGDRSTWTGTRSSSFGKKTLNSLLSAFFISSVSNMDAPSMSKIQQVAPTRPPAPAAVMQNGGTCTGCRGGTMWTREKLAWTSDAVQKGAVGWFGNGRPQIELGSFGLLLL